ncbi:ABC transporter ATP-binding protein [Malaciobacter molluscorum LMG 25693]|uniref:ABC transporter ATP-binding protein n=1 Tax=Malaciobacter molluscorum LMG 25693 TaxID=870501 RepID=A0A2G1DK08_9BACT|nr:ATP-binding cassette domain-containing protein [Malaciobacter molluscorum]AXX91432.1 ABC transporter, ATP-binding protein [Malaciobacter molluscorum LMG 25693]PHO18821.1 ABC transporter ATP-binding protein [Malaciobacter molluscorum LMG 25693]
MNIIDFENIHVGYDEKIILKELTLKIKQNEHWAILGSNGCGKSTLIKLMLSEIHPRKKYTYKKEIMGKQRYSIFELKKQLGIITNDLHNYFEKNGAFLLGYEVVLSGFYSSIGIFKHQDFTKEQHDTALQTMIFLEIEELKDKLVCEMSTGQLRKCIIARALIHKPKAFILDEPTVGLDIKAQDNFIKLLRKLSKKSSIILVTHHIEEIFKEINKVALIKDNTIYKSGNKEDILNSKNLSNVFNINIELDKQNDRYFIKSINN